MRRGKEREGGKKRRLTTMKKIILAEKTRRKLEKAEAAARYDYIQGGRGHWAVYYSGPQSFILLFPYWLA